MRSDKKMLSIHIIYMHLHRSFYLVVGSVYIYIAYIYIFKMASIQLKFQSKILYLHKLKATVLLQCTHRKKNKWHLPFIGG